MLQSFRPAAQPDSRVKLSAQAAVVHGEHAVEAFGQLLVVGNHDQGGAQLVFELQHHFQRVGGVFAVEVAGGLVGQQAVGFGYQGAGDSGTLALLRATNSGIITFSSAENSGSRWWNW